VLEKVRQVSTTQSTVVILGETGTGKELVARAVHNQSSRKAKPIVKVNCAALPSALVESELFGREKGAYTGALSKQIGRFELADGSTIFLDEIGDLPLELQGKLLRVLQEGEFERLGSPATVRVNARVIAATNRDLSAAVREGTFREDLYYRLNVFTITVPPLREHPEDIPLLVWTFVRQFGGSMAKVINTIPKETMEALQLYPWPGNVRQLRNVIEHAMIISTGSTLNVDVPKVESASASEGVTLIEMERRHILDVLGKTRWRVSGSGGAAEVLGMRPTTLESRMKKQGIQRRD
jgi:formate hydrogenlyase transcriptional activator